ncbi:hypothetical protein [Phaeacidiphilus oryzae]|uniref:hypothetical protein n=1 Tax=Phaeacidiphilus oryzae TaxID=348818 RepID=UPI00056C0154|nr:hypothetical protein [Phaeacidiphilus oryzae]
MTEIDPLPLCRLRRRTGDDFTVLELHGEIDLAALDTLLPQMERAVRGPPVGSSSTSAASPSSTPPGSGCCT